MARPVAVITGGARGIGLESARQLQATHRVALLDVDAAGVEAAAASLGGDTVWAVCDVTDAASVTSAVADVVERCGGIDVAIANAGIATAGGMRHLDPEVLAVQLDVNLTGAWRFVHACLPHVVARRGYVLGVASAAAIVPPTGIGFYAASKAGLEQLLNVLRQEVAPLGVDVGVAYFSWIDTDMVRGAETHQPAFARLRSELRGPAGRTLPVSAAGAAIAGAVADRRRTVVGPGPRARRLPPARAHRPARRPRQPPPRADGGPRDGRARGRARGLRGRSAPGRRPRRRSRQLTPVTARSGGPVRFSGSTAPRFWRGDRLYCASGRGSTWGGSCSKPPSAKSIRVVGSGGGVRPRTGSSDTPKRRPWATSCRWCRSTCATP